MLSSCNSKPRWSREAVFHSHIKLLLLRFLTITNLIILSLDKELYVLKKSLL